MGQIVEGIRLNSFSFPGFWANTKQIVELGKVDLCHLSTTLISQFFFLRVIAFTCWVQHCMALYPRKIRPVQSALDSKMT